MVRFLGVFFLRNNGLSSSLSLSDEEVSLSDEEVSLSDEELQSALALWVFTFCFPLPLFWGISP